MKLFLLSSTDSWQLPPNYQTGSKNLEASRIPAITANIELFFGNSKLDSFLQAGKNL